MVICMFFITCDSYDVQLIRLIQSSEPENAKDNIRECTLSMYEGGPEGFTDFLKKFS